MKFILILSLFIANALVINAQSSSGSASGPHGKAGTQIKKPATQLRGTGQYHGSKDTTPGSPMGTGGAGGNEMSGSQAGSASESALQSEKENQQSGKESLQTGDQTASQGSKAVKSNVKKKRVLHKNRRM